jgi:hypothetical protein
VANINRRLWHAAADADRHQHRLDTIVAKAVRPAKLVQHQVLGAETRLDHFVTPGPANGQDARKHQEVFDHLVGMTSGVFADRLMHQAQGELPRLEGARIVCFGRAAGADIAHLRALQLGKAPAAREGVPVEALVGVAADESPHPSRQVARLCLGEKGHDTLPVRRFCQCRPGGSPAQAKSVTSLGP